MCVSSPASLPADACAPQCPENDVQAPSGGVKAVLSSPCSPHSPAWSSKLEPQATPSSIRPLPRGGVEHLSVMGWPLPSAASPPSFLLPPPSLSDAALREASWTLSLVTPLSPSSPGVV